MLKTIAIIDNTFIAVDSIFQCKIDNTTYLSDIEFYKFP